MKTFKDIDEFEKKADIKKYDHLIKDIVGNSVELGFKFLVDENL